MAEGQGLMAVWLLGASMGLTACTATCLPFMGTWMVARAGERDALWKDTAGFISGRIGAYTLLGLIAALAGQTLERFLAQGLGHLLIGGASLAAALWLLGGSASHKPCALARGSRGTATATIQFQKTPPPQAWHESAPPFAVGFALSLIPCAPLASLLAVCAQAGQAGTGALQGLTFGLGAALTPLLILLPLLGQMGRQLQQGRLGAKLLRWAGAGILMALGLRQILQGLGASQHFLANGQLIPGVGP